MWYNFSSKDNNDKSKLFRIEVFYEEAGGQARAGGHKCKLLMSSSIYLDSQILIRDPFKKNETRSMINPILCIKSSQKIKQYSGPINSLVKVLLEW